MHRCPPPSEPSPLAAPPEALYGGQLETLRLALAGIIGDGDRAGLFRLYSTQLEGLGAGFMMVFPGNSMVEGVRKNTRLTADDADAVEAGVPEVLAATAYFFDRRPVSLRASTAEAVGGCIRSQVSERPSYGYRFVTAMLNTDVAAGQRVNHKRTYRLIPDLLD